MGIKRYESKKLDGKINKEITDSNNDTTYFEAAIALKVTADGGTFVVPTSDPGVAGALWNNSSTLSISAG